MRIDLPIGLTFRMPRRFRRLCQSRRARAATVWLCATVYCVAAFGIPLPITTVDAPANAGPYPCASHCCGCQNAEQCWNHCCCFTPAHRLAWYKNRRLSPPSPSADCDERSIASIDHDHAGNHQAASCCLAAKQRGGKARPPGVVILTRAHQCQGQATFWLSIGAVPPLISPSGWRIELAPSGWIVAAEVLRDSPLLAPPVPPPRLAIA